MTVSIFSLVSWWEDACHLESGDVGRLATVRQAEFPDYLHNSNQDCTNYILVAYANW